ncbi:MAG TPA: hypothetical protein VNK47_02130 [Candidatus Dormibacteraeota bacterium]|nr:hypothetical protein [Candidatus Dormibacteraeota bacterium]
MKYALIVVAVIGGIVLIMLVPAIFTHIFDNHERAGHFDIYSNPKVPDSSVSSALYYKRHRLSERLNGYSVDPNNPDRILFSSDDAFHGGDELCGTFVYDGQSNKLTRLRPWPYSGRLWSPDSRFILLDRATVRELSTGEEVDLTDSVSREDGTRVDLSVLQWSPDSQRLAGFISISPDGYELDLDLIQIALTPLSVRYVATINNSSRVWTEKEIRWSRGELQAAVPSTPDLQIVVRPLEKLRWTSRPPSVPPRPPLHEHYCSVADDKTN